MRSGETAPPNPWGSAAFEWQTASPPVLQNFSKDLVVNRVGSTRDIAAAIAFWVIGRWLIGKVVSLMQAAMSRNNVDPTLTKYLGSIVAISLNIALVLGILGYFGIQTTSFAAMLAGAGVAIGAAWSGMLGNFAAGAFMLVLRPFKVGDFVQVGGITGTIHELGLFGTTLITPDNVMTIVGNGKVFGDTIQNFSALPVRRVDRSAQLAGSVDPLEAIARFLVPLPVHRPQLLVRDVRRQCRRRAHAFGGAHRVPRGLGGRARARRPGRLKLDPRGGHGG